MRKIGLDIGSRSCGIALSDPFNIIAQGKENLRFDEKDWETMFQGIDKYIEEYEIDTIVIGYPTLPSGDKSQTTLMIEDVEELIIKRYSQKVVRIPEDMTTKKAHEILISAGITREKRKLLKDQLAAQFILTDYLARI